MNMTDALGILLVAVVISVIAVLMYLTGQQNAVKDERLQQSCIAHGGSYIWTAGCLR